MPRMSSSNGGGDGGGPMSTSVVSSSVAVPGSGMDRCAQCNATGVPLLAPDEPLGQQIVPVSPANLNKPRYCNSCMIGKKVRVFWPVDECWYTGIVHEYDPSTGEHLLRYEDGDSEWVRIGSGAEAGGIANTISPGESSVSKTYSSSIQKPPLQHHHLPYAQPPPPPPPHAAPDHAPYSSVDEGPMSQHHPPPPGLYYGDPRMGAPHPPPPPPSQYHPGGAPVLYYPGPPHHHHPMPPAPPYLQPPMGRDSARATPMHPSSPSPDPHEMAGSPTGGGRSGKKGPKAWSKHEDATLLKIVQSMSMPMRWSVVAQSLPDRTGKQCRERYVNHLNPRLKSTDWNPVEDATVFHLYNTIGSHWSTMSRVIPGRTDNGIKNRFHNLRRQLEREDGHRLRLSNENDFPDQIHLSRTRKFPKHLQGKADELWDIESGIGVLSAQSVLGNPNTGGAKSFFGPFRAPEDGEQCVRCGYFVPSVQTGREICDKTGWCIACTRIPPHLSGNLLRECLNLRRCVDNPEQQKIIESWDDPPQISRAANSENSTTPHIE